MTNDSASAHTITFLGTAGARFMVSRQTAASGGIWLDLGGTRLLIDPGPGSIVQATGRGLDPETLSAIILSHRHLDHSADVNIMIEAMTNGGFNRHGRLYAPADAVEQEPVIFSYLRDYIEEVVVLEEGGEYTVGTVTFTTPVRHRHAVETYGMVFTAGGHTFSYIADSGYFDGLAQKYRGEVLIINMLLSKPRPQIAHLSAPEVERIIGAIRPRAALLSHFGMHVWQEDPDKLAADISRKTGVEVIAAKDGMVFDLAKLEEIQP